MAFCLIRFALLIPTVIAITAPAFAGTFIDFGFVPLGGAITYSPDGAVSSADTISGLDTIPQYIVNVSAVADTTGLAIGSPMIVDWNSPITFTLGTTQTLTSPVTETFNGADGAYSAVFNSLYSEANPGSTSLSWVLEGELTLPASLGDPTQDIFLSAAFTNISFSASSSTNVSLTETSSPPLEILNQPPVVTVTPEPASIAVLAIGLLGMSIACRRDG